MLRGHDRPLTAIKFNHEGDLFWSTAKNNIFVAWYWDNGERLGTYSGHNGSVWSIDVSRDSNRLITGSADNSAKAWDAQNGKELQSWIHNAPVRSVSFALGDREFLSVNDQVIGQKSCVRLWDVNSSSKNAKPFHEFTPKNEAKIIQAHWGPLNRTIITCNEDGRIIIFDVRKGEPLKVIMEHTRAVMSLDFNAKKTLFLSASKDGTAKLFETKNWTHLKTYDTGRPLNACSIAPKRPEIIVGGGQTAESVTTTRVDPTQFKVRFFHMIYEEEIGSIAGHFGPVNCLSYNPDGSGFVSGSEDGVIRMHHFDPSYFETNF